MNKQEAILLLNCLHPNFFEGEAIRALPEGEVFEELILPLSEFDPRSYPEKPDAGVSFGPYTGSLDELKKGIEKVDKDWTQFYTEKSRIFCGYLNGEVASFCLVDDMGEHEINGRRLKIGGPGCVGTIPEYRRRGIGLTMVQHVTQLLKEEGFDYSYIHYTTVGPWYEKLGYQPTLRWDRNGIK